MINKKDLNEGRIEIDAVNTSRGRFDVAITKEQFIEICNNSGWEIQESSSSMGFYTALCDGEVCCNYDIQTQFAVFFPELITKPSRIRQEDVLAKETRFKLRLRTFNRIPLKQLLEIEAIAKKYDGESR